MVFVIVIVLIVSAILASQKTSALESYNRNVNQIARESQQQVSAPLFRVIVGSGGREALEVEQQIDELKSQAQRMALHAKEMSVPGEVAEAQRNLVSALDMRAEALAKISSLMHMALGGQEKTAGTNLAGAMEILLASDVIWSQRVTPLVQEALSSAGIRGQSTAVSRSLPNLGWLSAQTTLERIGGKAAAESGPIAPGTHGHALTGVSVGASALQAEPTTNHIASGANPTFAVAFQNTGENVEHGVKVVVAVTSAGKTVTGSKVVPKTEPGQSLTAEVSVSGVSTGVESKVEAKVEAVRGETDLENNKASYLAIFE